MHPFPRLYVDLDIVESNIRTMASKAEKSGAEFRPHFKTHQSKKIGRMFRDFGVTGITVSSLKMASYFNEDDWGDITIAFPANVLASEAYNKLAQNCTLKTLVSSREVIESLDKKMQHKMGLYVDIDPEYGRSGIPVSDIESIKAVVNSIEQSKHFYPAGFYCHSGHTYKARSKDQIIDIAEKVLDHIQALKSAFPDQPVCFGDTPSCSVLDNFSTVDQLSPGNFVFYDWMQVKIGACSPNEIAVYMECPVIEKYPNRKQVLIHGGAVHFSKDSVEADGIVSFGEPRLKYLSEETYVSRISQEHGIITCSPQVFDEISIGDTIQIFPVHSCLTADLMREYHTKDGQVLDHMNGQKASIRNS